jgi:hypothetical protein
LALQENPLATDNIMEEELIEPPPPTPCASYEDILDSPPPPPVYDPLDVWRHMLGDIGAFDKWSLQLFIYGW